TVRPFHSMCRGTPTFTDSSRVMSLALGPGWAAVPLQNFVGIQASVDSVWHDALTRLEGEFLVVEEDLDLVRLEGDEVGDACDLGPRPRIGPCRLFMVADVVVAGQALIGAERLSLDWDQHVLGDVLAR